jgi:hypothetical protein
MDREPDDRQPLVCQRSSWVDPKAYFAIARVPSHANNATGIPDGMAVLFDPLVETKSGPHKAQTDTGIHIAVIASDATSASTVAGLVEAST